MGLGAGAPAGGTAGGRGAAVAGGMAGEAGGACVEAGGTDGGTAVEGLRGRRRYWWRWRLWSGGGRCHYRRRRHSSRRRCGWNRAGRAAGAGRPRLQLPVRKDLGRLRSSSSGGLQLRDLGREPSEHVLLLADRLLEQHEARGSCRAPPRAPAATPAAPQERPAESGRTPCIPRVLPGPIGGSLLPSSSSAQSRTAMVASRPVGQMTGAGGDVKNRVDFETAAGITLFSAMTSPSCFRGAALPRSPSGIIGRTSSNRAARIGTARM